MNIIHLAVIGANLLLAPLALAESAPRTLPGLEPFPVAVQQRLDRAFRAKGNAYTPRTRHRFEDGRPHYTNRLLLEPSPYLLQHAHNPVNWYPWGDEAFTRAKKENKPVFLSVGYSTCHWCHVMERESFEDRAIAEYLNRHYIAVKVDREQRPDVDDIYMTAVHMLAGRGGWPLTVWLTPDRQPFYGGTYFPPRDGMRGQPAGLLTLLTRLQAVYRHEPDHVAAVARKVTQGIRTAVVPEASARPPARAALTRATEQLAARFDTQAGGFGPAPKFPHSVSLEFLLRSSRRTGDAETRNMVTQTLEALAAGGIYDQVGGGFHRYATDRQWRVPHFEKMLYDNALLAVAYLEGYQTTGREDFAGVARETLEYLDREMSAPGGGFYAATDADSTGAEGKFFTWTFSELDHLLNPAQLRLVRAHYGVMPRGNFEGANILHIARPLRTVAKELGLSPDQARHEREAVRAILYRARQRRSALHTDTKVLVAWNGLAISAFARGAHILNLPAYASRAEQAATFLLTRVKRDGRLRRSALGTRLGGPAYLSDYACLIAGLLDLYEVTFELRWLREALALQAVQDALFWDDKNGGYFLTANDAEQLLARAKPAYDGAEPSGNAVAAHNLLRLAEWTMQAGYRQRAQRCFHAFAAELEQRPTNMLRMLSALDFFLDRPKEIAIVKASADDTVEPFLAQLRRHFLPNRVVAVVTQGDELDTHQQLVPWLEAKRAINGQVTAYVCERHVCSLPTADPVLFAKQIAATSPLFGVP